MIDPYSQKQKDRLTQLRSNWLPFFGEYPYRNGQGNYFLVTIPSGGNPSVNLFLDAADEEITVSFGFWESHYPNPSEPDNDELESALAEVERIQREEHLIASYWHGEKWVGSRIVGPGDPLEMRGFAEEATLVKVLSWSGRLNREVAL